MFVSNWSSWTYGRLVLPSALVLAMMCTAATADTITKFNIAEPFGGLFAFIESNGNPDNAQEVDVSGSLTINVSTGAVTSSAVTASHVADGPLVTFSTIHSVHPDGTSTGTDVTLFDAFNLDQIILDIPVLSFVGYSGGEIDGSFGSDTLVGNGLYDPAFVSVGAAQLVPQATVAATPLPAALPLFVGGLSGLGLLGWRRRRRAQASVA